MRWLFLLNCRLIKIAKQGFTLTEAVLIIAIVGTIAILVIPPLIKEYKDKAWNTASEVFEIRMNTALNRMNVNETLAGYKSTEEFVNALSKNIKITKICKNDNLHSCFSDKVYWGTDNEKIDMATIKTARHLGFKNWNTKVLGLQFSNGITGVIAYNPECKQNGYSNQIDITNCLALLYDTDGYKLPNTMNKDLRGINVVKLGAGNCTIDLLNGTCFTAPLASNPVSRSECKQLKQKGYPINDCPLIINDYWAGAVKTCKDIGSRLPNSSELEQLASELYGKKISGAVDVALDLDEEKAESMGFSLGRTGSFSVWSDEEASTGMSYYRYFNSNNTGYSTYGRAIDGRQVICVAD